MITVNPITFYNKKHISFGEGTTNNVTPTQAILSLQGSNIEFTQNLERAGKADTVQSNPLTAIACKIMRTIDYIKGSKPKQSNTAHFSNTHINYAA